MAPRPSGSGGKFLVRLREDGESLAVRISFDAREILMASKPEVFFITDHYLGHPSVLVRLSIVEPTELRGVLEEAWRQSAPKRLVAEYERRER